MHRRTAALLAAAALAGMGSAGGAPPGPADAFDAHPQEDNFMLPMPGGARMVFRPVWLGVGDKLLATRDFSLGDREKKNYKEGIVPVKLGGSFVADNHGQRDALFYLGKYEVTRAQFASLPPTGEATGKKEPDAGRGDLPQTDLTTTQVTRFVADYDAWLHASGLDALPKYEGNVGIVRLPTEVEWEFAARGGVALVADPGRFDARTPYGPDLVRHEWFAGPQSSLNKLKAVGKLLPNPLGIYDLLGNAAELTCDPYRIEYGQGVQGGLTVRGGSFRTPEDDVRASLRTEQPIYGRDGKPPHDDSIGFRLVITASQVFTDQNRSLVESAARDRKPTPTPTPAPLAPTPPPTLPADAQLVDNEITHRRAAIDNEQRALRIGGGPALAKGNRVRAVRDEKMYFDQTMRRTSQAGEVFPVAFHDVARKKVFVLVNDPGHPTPVALSIAEDALEMVPRDAETLFRESLDALQARDFGRALPLLGQAVQGNPTESVYTAVSAAVGRVVQTMQAQAAVPQRQKALLDQAASKRHNANVARQTNALSGATYGAEGEADKLDDDAGKLEQKAQDLAKDADTQLKAAVDAMRETAHKLDGDGAPDVTLSLYRCLLPTDAPAGCSERAARAEAAYTAAWAANRAGQLYQSRSLVKAGLEIAARHRRLSSLSAVVAADTALVERAVHVAGDLEQKGQAAAAAVLARHAALLCHDCDELNGMSGRLASAAAP